MRKTLLILTILPLFSFAQKSLLYEVTNPKNGAKSYLFGTMHVQEESAFQFNDSVFWAIDQSQKTAFELDLSMDALKNIDKESMKELIDTQYLLDFGTYLQENFVPKLMKEIPASELAKKLTENLLPAYMELVKAKMSPDNRSFFVDQYLQNYAIKNEKEVIGIETYMEQIKAFVGDINSFDYEKFKVSDKMIKFLKKDDFNFDFVSMLSGTEQMVNDYSTGNLDGLCDYVSKEVDSKNKFTKGLYHRIFTERNEVMFDRTRDQVSAGGIFIAVGAGHLCGDNGLLAQYETAGFSIRPMQSHVATNQTITWKTIETETYSIDIPVEVELSENESSMEVFGIALADTTFTNTLFTTQGMARFKVVQTDLSQETTDEPYDFASLMKQMQELQADTSVDIRQSEDEAAEEMTIEVVEEAEETQIIEIDQDTEMDYYETDEEQAEQEVVYIEDYDTYDNDPSMKSKFQSKLTEEQKAYFKEFSDSVGTYFKREMGTMMMSMMGLMGGNSDTITVANNTEEMTLVFNKSMLGNDLSTTLEKDNISYKLTISGDPAILKSEEVRRFFTSFRLK